MVVTEIDFLNSGMTIQQAMVAHVKRHPNKETRPKSILWGKHRIQTSDSLSVSHQGIVRLEFLSWSGNIRQGTDLKVDGWIEFAGGEHVSLLRTWRDDGYEDAVEYPFVSRTGVLWTWNVYEMTYPSGEKVEEKWTENAGFWVEPVSESSRIYHCAHGMATSPDFDSLVYMVSVRPR